MQIYRRLGITILNQSAQGMQWDQNVPWTPFPHSCLNISCGYYISQDITSKVRWGEKQISYVTGLICPSLNTFAGREGYARLVSASCGRWATRAGANNPMLDWKLRISLQMQWSRTGLLADTSRHPVTGRDCPVKNDPIGHPLEQLITTQLGLIVRRPLAVGVNITRAKEEVRWRSRKSDKVFVKRRWGWMDDTGDHCSFPVGNNCSVIYLWSFDSHDTTFIVVLL